MKKTVLLFAMLLTAAVGMAKDIKTLLVTTQPQMHCDNCEKKIKGNLRFEKGVRKIETNIDAQTVTIEYDADKVTPEKIINAFSKFGYNAREIKADEKVEIIEGEECTNM